VLLRSPGGKVGAATLLFPLADHLVALTACGSGNHASAAVQTLRMASPKLDRAPRVYPDGTVALRVP